jgi:hypothetical protein
MTQLTYKMTQARIADLHREAALQRRAALVRPRGARSMRRASLRWLRAARPWRRTVSEPPPSAVRP